MSHTHVGHHATEAVRKLSKESKHFLENHPLFGNEGNMPTTAQRLKDLAQQVNDGLITEDEADLFANQAANEEYDSLDETVRQDVDRRMAEGFLTA